MTTIAPARPRLAFAGLGWIGRNRMEAVASIADVALICDPAIDSTITFDALLRSDADAVVIATPSALHAEQAIAALNAGKSVFCQKPLGRNAAETRRVVDAARANDRLLGVDLSYRHTPAPGRRPLVPPPRRDAPRARAGRRRHDRGRLRRRPRLSQRLWPRQAVVLRCHALRRRLRHRPRHPPR